MAPDILTHYYSRRAREYEEIYHRNDPARQREQQAIANELRRVVQERRVLEIACGTGYWTRFAIETAAHVCGIDSSPEMLALARAKNLPESRVQFHRADAYDLRGVSGDFDACVAMFWFSHLPRARVELFLDQLRDRLGPDSVVFMADNILVAGIGGELVHPEGSEDTYKIRTLADGSTERVLKNYFNEKELRQIFEPYAHDLQITMGECFWWLNYRVRPKRQLKVRSPGVP
jgi:SAM-dependent methyltransferase